MPHHIDGLDVHTEEHHCKEHTIAQLLVELYPLVDEVQGEHDEAHNSAVYLRTPVETGSLVNVYRVVLVGEHTRYQLKSLEHCPVAVVRLGEVELTKCKGIVYGKYHECTAHEYYQCGNSHDSKCLEIFDYLLELPVGTKEEVVNEVDSYEYSYHKADIEVCNEHYCKGDDVVYLSSVVDEVLNTENDKRKEDRTVYPHRVDELDNDVAHHSVH